jgi:putative membrane protein
MTAQHRTDPEIWQRLSPWAVVFIVVTGIQKFVRQNLPALLGAGAGFAFVDWLGLRELAMAGTAVLLIIVVSAMMSHRRFRFRLEDDAIRVRQGIFERKELRVRFERVQNLSLSQPFYLRPFGLVRFALETAGGQQREVELPGISRELAGRMRERIARLVEEGGHDETPGAAVGEVAGAERMYRARGRDLFLHGLASNQIWVMIGAMASLLAMAERRLGSWWEALRVPERFEAVFGEHWLAMPLAVAVFGLALLLLLFLLSGLISLLRFHGFELSRLDDRFRARFGLLDRREQTLRESKLQALTQVQTAVGRLLGRAYLICHQTSAGEANGKPRDQRFTVPGLDRDTLAGVTRRIRPALGTPDGFDPIAPAFRRFFWLRLGTLSALALVAGWLTMDPPVWLIGLVLPAFVLVWLGVLMRWRRWGWRLNGGMLWVRRGLIGQRVEVFGLDRVQQVQLRQNPFQRRHGLADLVLILPHGPVKLPFLPLEEARMLANRSLYAVETAASHLV